MRPTHRPCKSRVARYFRNDRNLDLGHDERRPPRNQFVLLNDRNLDLGHDERRPPRNQFVLLISRPPARVFFG